jgi:hypothetical protein
MKKLVPFISFLIFLTACEKTVKIDIPQKDPKLVVNAWLEKDQTIELVVGKSRHILQQQSNNLREDYTEKNAVPVIYENNIAIDTLIYQPGSYSYKSINNKTVKTGQTYSIKVTAPGYEQAESVTIVPTQSEIAELRRTRNARTNSFGNSMDEVLIKINDPVEKNFYLVQVFGSSFGSSQGMKVYCVSTTDKDIEPIGDNADPLSTDNCYDGGSLLLSDVNFNGRQKQIRLYIESNMIQDYTAPDGRVYRPYVKVQRITEDYFRYVKSYHNYYNASGNPFAEPVNVYSNVKNGFGSFSAYTMAVDSLR